MRKPMQEDEEIDWSDFDTDGETEPGLKCAVPVLVDDDIPEDEIITLRSIRAAKEFVEQDRESCRCIAVCVSPESVGRQRSEIPLAGVALDLDEIGGD